MGLFKNKGKGLDKVLKFASKVTSGMPIVGAVVSAAEKLVPDEGSGSGGGLIGSGALKGLLGKGSEGGSNTSSTPTNQNQYKTAGDVTTTTSTADQWKSFSTWPIWAKIGVFALPGGLLILLVAMGGKKKGSRYGR